MGLQCSVNATVPWSSSTRRIFVFQIWTSNFKFASLIQWLPFHTMLWKNCTLSLNTSFPSISRVYIYAAVSVVTLLVTFFRETVKKCIVLYIIVFIIFQSHYFTLSLCKSILFNTGNNRVSFNRQESNIFTTDHS